MVTWWIKGGLFDGDLVEKFGRILELALIRWFGECLARNISLELHRVLGILGWKTRIISEMLVSCQSALSLE